MMDELISRYEYKIIEAGCAPVSGRYGLQVNIPNDISPVLPYLNSLLDSTRYDHQNCILIWREDDRAYALRPHEMKIVQSEGIIDPVHSGELVREVVARINDVWRNREHITPCYAEKGPPKVIDIVKLLPKTNCKQCGCPTCLVFAADLSEDKIRLESCPPLHKPQYSDNRQKLIEILLVKQKW